jgi:hypothetical protein
MLILQPTATKRSAIWRPGAAYAILRDDDQIGRIDISGVPKRDGEAQITLREQVFDCRIHITGRAGWTYVPSRWVMSSGGVALHAATWESGKTFLTEAETEQQPLWLRREAFGTFAVELASDHTRVGEITRVKPRLLPKRVATRIALETRVALAETFEVMLLWVFVQNDYQSSSD